jgi:hypothetical protein
MIDLTRNTHLHRIELSNRHACDLNRLINAGSAARTQVSQSCSVTNRRTSNRRRLGRSARSVIGCMLNLA